MVSKPCYDCSDSRPVQRAARRLLSPTTRRTVQPPRPTDRPTAERRPSLLKSPSSHPSSFAQVCNNCYKLVQVGGARSGWGAIGERGKEGQGAGGGGGLGAAGGSQPERCRWRTPHPDPLPIRWGEGISPVHPREVTDRCVGFSQRLPSPRARGSRAESAGRGSSASFRLSGWRGGWRAGFRGRGFFSSALRVCPRRVCPCRRRAGLWRSLC